MRIQSLIVIIVIIGSLSCNNRHEKSDNNPSFMKHIKFNHLFIVIDESTYNYLFDSLNFFNDFSYNSESQTDANEESWTGKYIDGKHNYIEIFKPNGYKGAKFGEVGFGFMTNKIGTLDSVYNYWKKKNDSVSIKSRDIVNKNGDTLSWFRYISLPNQDSLPIDPWLMENTRELMISKGFTNIELESEIEYWDYLRRSRANYLGTSPDSIKYNKLFGEVTALHLTLSEKELDHLEKCLTNFGFSKKDNMFSNNNFKIIYTITESMHFILNQIDFSLLDTLVNKNYSYRHIDIVVNGNEASLKFNYY